MVGEDGAAAAAAAGAPGRGEGSMQKEEWQEQDGEAGAEMGVEEAHFFSLTPAGGLGQGAE